MSKKPVLMPKAERREAALAAALKLAKKVGARRVSMAMVAAAQKVTAPLLFHIFGSREGLTKAILKGAKAQGIVLPEAAPTVREARAASRKPTKLKALPKLKKPAKLPARKLAPPKPLPNVKPKKLAALLSPKVNKTGKLPALRPKLPINVVKAIKNKEAAKTTAKDTSMPKKGKQFGADAAAVVKPARKPLTPAQKTAKAQRDAARRAPPVVSTPASKFAALPTPFEASVQAVSA